MSKLFKQIFLLIIIAAIVIGLAVAGTFYWKNLRGIWPVVQSPASDIAKELEPGKNSTDIPLKLPAGFSIEIFAKDLPDARVLAFDSFGNMWVSQTSEGLVSLLEVKDGKVVHQSAVFKNLRKPHGLAFDPDQKTLLYIGEENGVYTVPTYSEGKLQKIIDLPSGAGHFTRSVGIGPDKKLYISIGSSCNVCNESDDRRAKIFVSDRDGGNFKEFARGLRNSVFFTWSPFDGKMWATEMGRDLLGDDIPPDEINIINQDGNYGWPNCYGKNIHDDKFDKNEYIRNPCMEPFESPSYIDIQAHSAPLGLGFVPKGAGWPNEYEGDLIVAFHGSWNRTQPTGYKVVRIKLGPKGEYQGTEDFITGWLSNPTTEERALGRPVDIKFGPDGGLYISDDKSGVIYKVKYGN
jgi:glucose/arabinose dehydrogenase